MIMFTQAEIDDMKNQNKIGSIVKVLVEGRDEIIKKLLRQNLCRFHGDRRKSVF